MSLTAHARTVDALLTRDQGTPLADYLTALRSEGLSYFQISRSLADLTGGAVDVTGETIRNWLNNLEVAK